MFQDAISKIDGILMMQRDGDYNAAKAGILELREMIVREAGSIDRQAKEENHS